MRTQVVRTAPLKVVIGKYITAKGAKLLDQPNLSKAQIKAIKEKYTKNRKGINVLSEPLTASYIDSKGRLRTKQKRIQHVGFNSIPKVPITMRERARQQQ